MNDQLEPGNPGYDRLAEATLGLYIVAYGQPEKAGQAAKALLLWDLLTELDLAVPPEWVAAVWHTQDVERAKADS